MKFLKNGQWTLEKSDFPDRNPDGSWHPEYKKEAEDHLKTFYSHSPEAQNYLRENLWNVPKHLRNAEKFKDWSVTPSHSTKTEIMVPTITPEGHAQALANQPLSAQHIQPNDWKPSMEHHYDVGYKGKHMGTLSIFGDAEGGGSWSHGLVNSVGSHVLGRPVTSPSMDEKDKSNSHSPELDSELRRSPHLSDQHREILSHVMGNAFLHHVNSRVAWPGGKN